jgi:ribosomal protein S12 methylthiotransferase accessory factor
MGITRLANVTGLDTIGIPVVMSVRPNSRSLSVSQGKGLDLDSAKASAAMESAEGFHAERVAGPLQLASYDELRERHAVADPLRLPLSDRRPFRASTPMLWIDGEDWRSGGRVYVPFQLVHTAYTTHMRWDLAGFAASTTGLASGNHVLEAVCHALCEIIERDATARFAASPDDVRANRQVDLGSIDDPDCLSVLERFDAAGVAVAVWEITSHVGLPAFECLIAERTDDPLRLLSCARGFGCHLSRTVALLRALTEAAQSRLTIIAGSRDDLLRTGYDAWSDPENVGRWRAQAATPGRRRFAAAPSVELDSFDADLGHLMDAVARAGCDQVIVVDLTRPEIGVPVVQVIVPGLHDEGHRPAVGRPLDSLP